MPQDIINFVSSQGIWSLLSFILIYYILKQQEARDTKQDNRELKYQEIINNLTSKFELIYSDVQEIKKKLDS